MPAGHARMLTLPPNSHFAAQVARICPYMPQMCNHFGGKVAEGRQGGDVRCGA